MFGLRVTRPRHFDSAQSATRQLHQQLLGLGELEGLPKSLVHDAQAEHRSLSGFSATYNLLIGILSALRVPALVAQFGVFSPIGLFAFLRTYLTANRHHEAWKQFHWAQSKEPPPLPEPIQQWLTPSKTQETAA